MLLHGIEVGLLALARHPLEAVPEEVALAIRALLRLLLVGDSFLEVGMRGHIISSLITPISITVTSPSAISSISMVSVLIVVR